MMEFSKDEINDIQNIRKTKEAYNYSSNDPDDDLKKKT